jgi:hypothetical protein
MLLIIVGIVGALYVGGWLMFVGGIVQVAGALKATPVLVGALVWGLVKILVLAELLGGLIFWIGFTLWAALLDRSVRRPRRTSLR